MSFAYIILALLVLDVCWWILADGWLRSTGAGRRWRMVVGGLSLFMIANTMLWVIPPIISAWIQSFIPDSILATVFIWHLLSVPLGCIAMLLAGGGDLAWRGLNRYARKRSGQPLLASTGPDSQVQSVLPQDACTSTVEADAQPPEGMRLTRRNMIGLAAASVAPMVLVVGSGKAAADLQQFEVADRTIVIPDLPHELEGLTIAHVSDLHHGRFTNARFLDRVAETVNVMSADLVVFTGDLIDRNLRDLPSAISMCKNLRAKEGMAFCLGNHDLFDDRSEFIDKMRRANLPLLVDDQLDLTIRNRKLRLIGLDWQRSHDGIPESSKEYLLGHDPSIFSIALVHHPHAFEHVARAKIQLALSGHTHGGQLMLSREAGVGPMAFRYWSGLYRIDKSAMVVSNGVGNWFPIRLNAPAEIVKLTLKRA